nr:hypothetical protein [Tanacetum cinerariifolium]
MALGNQTSPDADLHIAADVNEPIPSPVEDADCLNWNWDDVIVIPSDDDEANVNEPIPLPVEDADVEPPFSATNFRCRKQGRHEESPSKRGFRQKLLPPYLLGDDRSGIKIHRKKYMEMKMNDNEEAETEREKRKKTA